MRLLTLAEGGLVCLLRRTCQYNLHFVDDIQHDYEVIRPIVLFGVAGVIEGKYTVSYN